MQPETLFESLFKRKISDPGNKEYLEHLTNTHPYFSPAQFYLLLCSGQNDESSKDQASRTALFFNNPYWLNLQLNRARSIVEGKKEIVADNLPPELPKEKSSIPSEDLLFEPLHSTDYFASQGIKLSEEVQTGDKLGKQLKSFTDWLKTMKRLQHSAAVPAQSVTGSDKEPDQVEKNIQLLAEKSNVENAVVTEAMAEVLARQGLNDKAIVIYQKLSLLDPPKSAYFAAKIDQLKGI